MRGLTVCLWGRPLYTFIWMLWTTATFGMLMVPVIKDGGSFVQQANFIRVISFIQSLLFFFWLLLLAAQKSGREWLMTVYHEEDSKKMGAFGCFLVRAMPVLETIALVVIFSSGN